ncbi:MAG: hypothetical protein K5831_01120 [Brevundimonas sp.]|uniref:hypothetical protein n=1 Tax=Brevundimonas sp. TaxID=1871086 RepID=UPI0025832CD3|nr:hypothetical protein [Brevundimonas sp.]MCV0413469.1 hypothetical protein [Brevundimonas sp.]
MATSTPLTSVHIKAALPSVDGFGSGAGQGYVAATRGTATQTGWLGFYAPNGTRYGWIGLGANGSRLTVAADTANGVAGWDFEQRPTFAGATPYDTSNLGNATTSAAGLMAAADKTKLNGIAAGATANSAESTSAVANTLVKRTGISGWPASIEVNDVLAARGNGAGAIFLGSTNRYLYWDTSKFVLNGAVEGTSFTPTSDLALKENLTVDLDDEQAVIAICQIARAEWDSTEDGAHRMGVVAQALSDVDPRWVTGGEVVDAPEPDQLSPPVWDEDAEVWRRPLRVDPMAMLSSAFAAIRSLANQNGALESRVAALEAALSSET